MNSLANHDSTRSVPTTAGLLLVGHGTQSRLGQSELLALARLVSEHLPGVNVEPAFLEMNEPSIGQALARLLERGARQVVVVPLLLFAAGHAKRDIPAAMEAAAGECGFSKCGSTLPVEHAAASSAVSQFLSDGDRRTTLAIHQAGHLGCDAHILQLSQARFTQSLHGLPEVPAERTCLVLVGRGSHDESAIAEMHHFAELRAQSPVCCVEVAFLAMAQPAVQDVLPQLAAEGWQRIVVQPHLLFHGELHNALEGRVQALAAQHSQQQWILTPYLAAGLAAAEEAPTGAMAADLLTAVIRERFRGAIRVVAPGGDG